MSALAEEPIRAEQFHTLRLGRREQLVGHHRDEPTVSSRVDPLALALLQCQTFHDPFRSVPAVQNRATSLTQTV